MASVQAKRVFTLDVQVLNIDKWQLLYRYLAFNFGRSRGVQNMDAYFDLFAKRLNQQNLLCHTDAQAV